MASSFRNRKNLRKKAIKKSDKSEVKLVLQSQCQNQKNTIDPEIMIKEYGADSVRWFILSDSPPEKDVQWSDVACCIFQQISSKIWNLNQIILNKKNTKAKVDQKVQKSFENRVDICVYKVDQSIKNFQFNVAIAQFYEIYKFLMNRHKWKYQRSV